MLSPVLRASQLWVRPDEPVQAVIALTGGRDAERAP
jgi:hypothetical protein